MKDFVHRVSTGEPPSVTVEDGCWVDSIIDALYRSGESKQRVELQLD